MTRPTISFARFRDAPKIYEAAADGTVVEAGIVYEFDVFEDGDVRLWLRACLTTGAGLRCVATCRMTGGE